MKIVDNFFINPEKSLKDLVKENTTFWKFSQSSPNTGLGEVGVYCQYIPKKIIKAQDMYMGISFVRGENLGICSLYGDQITKFTFDINNPDFQLIANTPIFETSNTFYEIKAQYLLVENNYSLADINTIKTIIKLSNEFCTMKFMIGHMGKYENTLDNLGFNESANFIRYIKKNYPMYFTQIGAKEIKNNIDEITYDFQNIKEDIELL